MQKNEALDSVVLPNLTFIGRFSFPFLSLNSQFRSGATSSVLSFLTLLLLFLFCCGCEMDALTGGHVLIADNPSITELSLPLLAEVDTDLEILSNDNLATFELPTLSSVGRDVAIRNNEQLSGFNLSGVAVVGRDLNIRNNQVSQARNKII